MIYSLVKARVSRLHLPQSLTTANEIWELARVSTQIVTPQTNAPIMGIVQDSLVGSYLLTMNDTKINKRRMMNILVSNKLFNGILPEPAEIVGNEPYWTGRQLVTTILPPINLQRFSNTYKEDSQDTSENYKMDSKIIIKNGILESGAIDKSVLGAKKEGSIAHVIFNDYSPERAKNFINLIQKYTNHWLLNKGFSVGIYDIVPMLGLRKKMDAKILETISQVQELVDQINEGTYIPPPGFTVQEFLEFEAIQKLNDLLSSVGSTAVDNLDPRDNALMAMVTSGSKGEKINIGQIMGIVGQQNVDRKRIVENFGQNRTLPQFQKFDLSPLARGFVEHSFLQGLSSAEFFFHAMTSREGIIDTAVRTGDSGYISRRLMKAMEDISIHYDNTVRNANNQIVQFLYGEDGIDPTKVEKQRIETVFMDNDEIIKRFEFETKEKVKKYITSKIADSMFTSTGRQTLDSEVKQIYIDRDFAREVAMRTNETFDDKFYLPVNVRRIIMSAMNSFSMPQDSTAKASLSPLKIIAGVNLLIEKIERLFVNQARFADTVAGNYRNAVRLFQILVRSNLASKRIICEYRLNQTGFDYIINEIERKFLESIIQPGEMVGAISSQSLGEPSTQLTLNTSTWGVEKATTAIAEKW